jgi:membrane complex biogenesis BtpA family protein
VSLMSLFSVPKAVVGMIHVRALPGTPRATLPMSEIVATAVAEAEQYTATGVDALLIENMHDVPYLRVDVGHEIVAAMTAVGCAVRAASPLPLGVQILSTANQATLAVALASGATFVRAENFAYAHVADEGLISEASAGPLLRYRRQIGATDIRVLADIKKKHASHALTADISLAEAARTAAFFDADGLVITGTATGQPTAPEDVQVVRDAVDVPICIGSGLTPDNLPRLWPLADVFIVGSYVKQGGLWSNPLDADRLARFVATARRLRDGAAAGTRP